MEQLTRLAALRQRVLPPVIPVQMKPLTEAQAFLFLHHWLTRPDQPENRWAFGAYIRLMLRWWGLLLVSTLPSQPSLQHRLLKKWVGQESDAWLSFGLGAGGKIIHDFWSVESRLHLTLSFCHLSASQVLVELAGWPPKMFTQHTQPYHPHEVVGLVDSFWRTKDGTERYTAHRVKLKHFGTFVKQTYLEWGDIYKLGLKVIPVYHSPLNSPESRDTFMTRLLQGETSPWSLPMLDALADFVRQPLKTVMADYAEYTSAHPLPA